MHSAFNAPLNKPVPFAAVRLKWAASVDNNCRVKRRQLGYMSLVRSNNSRN